MAVAENTGLVERLSEITERAAHATGIEIAGLDLRGSGKARLLRVYIDKPGGISHADCELISHRLGKLLDEEDAMPGGSYTLEVSSPGLERKLSRPRDFERVVGHNIRLTVKQPVEGRTRLEGKLVKFADGILQVETGPGYCTGVPLEQVQKANLKFEW